MDTSGHEKSVDVSRSCMLQPRVSIVIALHNRVADTRRCLETLVENTPDDLYEVVLVDDASTDATRDFLKLLDGDVKVISNETSVGVAQACNQGAASAAGTYLVFLSNDAEPQKGWLENLIDLAESDARVGAVGPKLLHPGGTLLECGGIIFSDATFHRYGSAMNPQDAAYNFVREVDYCSMAGLLVRRDAFDEVGGFDGRYRTAVYRAADLCFAIRGTGRRVLYQPAAMVVCQAEVA